MNYLICLSCFKYITYEISFSNIFKKNIKKEILCNICKNNLYYNIEYEAIPLNNKLLHLFYISNFNKQYMNDILELNLLKNAFIKAYKENLEIIYFPIYSKSLLNILDKIFIKDFILITSKERVNYENYS